MSYTRVFSLSKIGDSARQVLTSCTNPLTAGNILESLNSPRTLNFAYLKRKPILIEGWEEINKLVIPSRGLGGDCLAL